MDLDTKIQDIPGIGPRFTKRLEKLKIQTVLDLLFYFPRKYHDFSKIVPIGELQANQEVSVRGTILSLENKKTKSGRVVTTAVISDGSGLIQAVWFNQPYIKNVLKKGDTVMFSGKVENDFQRLILVSPVFEKIETHNLFISEEKKELIHTGRIVPVYSESGGITSKWLRSKIKQILPLAYRIKDFMPDFILKKYNLISLGEAIVNIHFPENHQKLIAAKKRLGFDELFLIQLNYLKRKAEFQKQQAPRIPFNKTIIDQFLKSLPFSLTADQKKALLEIISDLEKPYPANRLLEGDVGSGKTIVACGAILNVIMGGFQAALMCPTEVLARQHFNKIKEFFKNYPFKMELLLGSLKNKEKERIKRGLASGEINFVIGTHSLIQEDIRFKNLGLAIIDEQHRFGVEQRARLRQLNTANFYPHFLSMSATPIPRTLALALYGDLDLSIIKQMPPGRKPVITRLIKPDKREEAYEFVRKKLREGRQAFVICPLIEESDKLGVKAATKEYEKLKEGPFADFRIGILHGKMKSSEKDKIMQEFADGKIDILVATPVVEVGIDVPNATIMIIEGAERFGLASLHQFRGRVGRGEEQSYCLLFSENLSSQAARRLAAFIKSKDGFELAEKDLEIRGPGEIYGIKQHGLPDLKMASLKDVELIKLTKSAAFDIIKRDPELKNYPLLKEELEKFVIMRHLE